MGYEFEISNRVKRTVSRSPREEDRFFVYYHIFTVYLCEGVPPDFTR